MEEQLSSQIQHGTEHNLRSGSEQGQLEHTEVIINGQAYRKTVLPAFTREDAVKRHRAMMRTYMNDTRYLRERDGSIDVDIQDNYYD